MDIVEATLIATTTDKWITRNIEDGSPWDYVQIKPTDSSDNCIIKPREGIKVGVGMLHRRGWQPTAADLLADDWIVVEEKKEAAAGTTAMNMTTSLDNAKQVIHNYVEAEVLNWIQTTIEQSSTYSDLQTAMWNLGKVKKDGADIDRMLHQLVYIRFSQRMREIIGDAQKRPLTCR